MGKKILICEDEQTIAHIIDVGLEMRGHCVDVALTADQAVELYKAALSLDAPYELVITDVDMPGHTGLYFASHIRAQGYQGRIIVLTNLPFEVIAHSVISVNGEYLLKSDEITELHKAVDGRAVGLRRRATD